jgi:cytochrome c2
VRHSKKQIASWLWRRENRFDAGDFQLSKWRGRESGPRRREGLVKLEFLHRLRKSRYFIPACLAGFAMLAGICGLATFYTGYAIGRYEIGPFETAQRGEYKLFGVRFARAAEEAAKQDWATSLKRLPTIFFDLDVEIASVPVDDQGWGGGMTSFGDAALLVTQEGDIFVVRGADDIKPAAIEAPDNGYAAYKAAAEGPLSDLQHTVNYFRFNDILHFQSPERRGLALSYSEWDEDNACYRNAVAVLDIDQSVRSIDEVRASASDWSVVFRAKPCLPPKEKFRAVEGLVAGGRIAFKAPDIIYLGSGDYHWDGVYGPEALAQDPDNNYGKIVEINLSSGAARNMASGVRNPQGVLVDKSGRLWTVEHGMRGGDELNLIVDGGNYGWPLETLGTKYSGLPWPLTSHIGRHDAFIPPVYAWLPSVAISSLTQIENFHEAWDGDMLMASLSSGNLYRIHTSGDHVEFIEIIPVGQRIRYALQHTDGRIILWTDDHYLVFLTPSGMDATALFVQDYLAEASMSETLRNKVSGALDACITCHSLRPDENRAGPPLGAVAGARPGGTSWTGYSSAMRAAGGVWDEKRLAAFIDDPDSVIPGSTMPDPGIEDPDVRAELVELLQALERRHHK